MPQYMLVMSRSTSKLYKSSDLAWFKPKTFGLSMQNNYIWQNSFICWKPIGTVRRFMACFLMCSAGHWTNSVSLLALAPAIHFSWKLFTLGSVPSSPCWCSVCQNEVPVLTETLDAVVKVEMIINNHLQAPNLKAGIRRERCREELVILKESRACFVLIRAIKLLR